MRRALSSGSGLTELNKQTPFWLTALGRQPLPESLEVGQNRYTLRRVFKNDFFAVTALYESEAGKVLLKAGRRAPLFILPMSWVGRFLTARERACLRHLEGLPGIPKYLGPWGKTGLLREFVDGHAMEKRERVPDEFHDRLRALIDEIHRHGMAYVDLEKCENVLVGDDGNPYLFDFQIAWHWPRRWGGDLWPIRWLRRRFQEGDLYHLPKLKRRTRPDQMTEEQIAASYRKPLHVRAHRLIFRPLTLVRRAILNRIDPREKVGERGRVSDEDTVGATPKPQATRTAEGSAAPLA